MSLCIHAFNHQDTLGTYTCQTWLTSETQREERFTSCPQEPCMLVEQTCLLSQFSGVQLCKPWTITCQPPLSVDSPGKNTGVGCHFLL